MDLLDAIDDVSTRDWEAPDTEGTIRFAMVGCGWWTRQAAIPAVQGSDYCETTVAVSSSTEKASEVADEHDTIEAAITYDEFHDGAAADEYDAVYVCTPNALHLPYVETAADLGKAVLCEKPMEATAERAQQLVAAAERNPEPLYVGYRMQTDPVIRRTRDLVQSGALGKPIFVRGNMSQHLLDVIPDTDQWRLDPDLSGGTTLMDIGLYPLNTTRYLLDSDPTHGRANTEFDQASFSETGDEHVAFTLEFPDGATASCTASYGAYRSSSIRVLGTEGEVRIEPAFYPDEPRTIHLSTDGIEAEIDADQCNQMLAEFDYFGHCLLAGEKPHADARHGLVDVTIMDELYDSAEHGETVAYDF